MRQVYLCVLLGAGILLLGPIANAANGDGGLEGPTGEDQAQGEGEDDELDQCQMLDLCISGCEGSRQMDYWDCYNEYLLCVEDRDRCLSKAEKYPGSYHCLLNKTNIQCEYDHYLCQMAAEGTYNACEASCEAQYPNCP